MNKSTKPGRPKNSRTALVVKRVKKTRSWLKRGKNLPWIAGQFGVTKQAAHYYKKVGRVGR